MTMKLSPTQIKEIAERSLDAQCQDLLKEWAKDGTLVKWMAERIAAQDGEIAKLERERDAYRTRAQVAESGINRAVGAAHDSMPDYPWNTVRAGEELSSACWAWASSLKGASQACDDLRARIAQLESQIVVKDGALRFYAEEKNYGLIPGAEPADDEPAPVQDDGGAKAREALKGSAK